MLSAFEPIQFALVVSLVVGLGYLYSIGSPRVWYDILSNRLIYGVPWGTLVTIIGVVAFYLFVQSGFHHWDSPVVHPFRSWSYLYPEGLFAAGFAHAGPNHLIANMVGTVVLAPIVEYAWSHYPPLARSETNPYENPPPGDVRPEIEESSPDPAGWLDRPWVRAVVIFPAVVIVVSILTSLLALGWSLGFSGTVFAFGGFAVVFFPVTAILAMVGVTGTSVFVTALREPVLRATADPGAPGPPGWFGVNVQAHMMGFLLGVLLAVALLRYRSQTRDPTRVFIAALAFALTRQLWAFATAGGDDVYLQHRGVGLLFVLALSIIIGALIAATDDPVPGILGRFSWLPTRKTLAYLWLGAVGIIAAVLWIPAGMANAGWQLLLLYFLLVLVLAIPGLPVVVPDRAVSTPLSQKQILIFVLVGIMIIVALPSIASNAPGMDEDPVPGNESIAIQDYHVTYAEDVQHGRISSTQSGVIVVSEQRQIWTAVLDKGELAHRGEATVVVGGFVWRETVAVNRTGWDVAGGDDVYVVDLEHDGETSRAFQSAGAEIQSRVSNQTIRVVPDRDEFRLRVARGEQELGEVQIPALNETITVGNLQFTTERVDGDRSVFAEQDGTRVLVATKK